MSTPLVLVAGVLVLLGVALRRLQMAPKIGLALVIVGTMYGVVSAVAPRLGGSETDDFVRPSVKIVQPEDGEQVPLGEPIPVEVELSDGKIATSSADTEGGHLHIYVDDRLQDMPLALSTEVRLSPGEHTITVEFVDWQHISYAPKVQDEVTVVARD